MVLAKPSAFQVRLKSLDSVRMNVAVNILLAVVHADPRHNAIQYAVSLILVMDQDGLVGIDHILNELQNPFPA